MRLVAVLISMLILSPIPVFGEDKYTFDVSETEKKPYHFGGYVEAKPVLFGLDKDSALYKLKFYNRNEGKTLEEYNFKIQLEGSYETDISRFYFKTNTDYKHSYLGDDEKSDFYEGYLTIKPSPSLKMEDRKSVV